MSPQHWTLEDVLQLQELMQHLQLEDWQVAHLSALSVHQVRELLSGEPIGKASSFYSAAIKRHAGQRLLMKLGNGAGSNAG
jgi:hypothetical protein